MRTGADPPSDSHVETRIAVVGRDLARTFNGVLNAIPGGPHRPQGLARSLGVNTVLTSRILKAAQQHDPLAVAHMIPGPEPLRRLLRAAEKKKVSTPLIRKAAIAVDQFEQLIDREAGDRSALDAIISGWLPDAREQVELIAKQSAYRGTSHLLGNAADVLHFTTMLYPSRTPPPDRPHAGPGERADWLWINVTHGLRRVRPGPIMSFDTIHTSNPLFTIAGEPVEGLRGLLLEQFCSKPLPDLAIKRLADRVQYTLRGIAVGRRSAVTLVHATMLFAQKEMHRKPGEQPRESLLTMGIGMPAKTMVFDVLLHESVFPDQHPALKVFRGTVGDGPPRANDPGQDFNRIDVVESIQPLGTGIDRMRSSDTPNYQDILDFVCRQRRWDANALRGFRCRIEYPMYSSQVAMAFELPEHAGN